VITVIALVVLIAAVSHVALGHAHEPWRKK
jgi:hypothetical protein